MLDRLVLLDLGCAPRLKLTIEHPQSYRKAVVRVFFETAEGRRSCLDSPLLARSWAIELAHKIARAGAEVEVLGWRWNMVRPAPWQVHRTKNLGLVRLNKVKGLIRIEDEPWFRALPEIS